MKYQVIVEPAAESDIEAAFNWYQEQVEGLGHEFLVSLRACFSRLERTPEIYSPVLDSVKRARLERFPFGVFYLVESETVYILGVFHYRKNPTSWKIRVKLWG